MTAINFSLQCENKEDKQLTQKDKFKKQRKKIVSNFIRGIGFKRVSFSPFGHGFGFLLFPLYCHRKKNITYKILILMACILIHSMLLHVLESTCQAAIKTLGM